MILRIDPANRQSQTLTRQLTVFRSGHFRVTQGVNDGDPLGDASDLVCDDSYALTADARPRRLGLETDPATTPVTDPATTPVTDPTTGAFHIARTSGAGQPGARVCLDSLLTFMGADGATRDALVFVEVAPDGTIAEIYLAPLAPLEHNRDYTLVTIDRTGARARLAETAAVAFARGTRITLADGSQRPIERLEPGDRVLTRDSGPQVLRWIGCDTLRAAGPFAPIRIAPGALNNTGPLLVGPAHRLFVYQRVDALKRHHGHPPAGRFRRLLPAAVRQTRNHLRRGDRRRKSGARPHHRGRPARRDRPPPPHRRRAPCRRDRTRRPRPKPRRGPYAETPLRALTPGETPVPQHQIHFKNALQHPVFQNIST